MPVFLLPLLAGARRFLKSVPWQVFTIFGGILVLLVCWHLHADAEKAAYNRAFNAGYSVAVAKVKAAQQATTVAQIAVNHAPAAQSKAIAETSNADVTDYYAEGRRAGLAYAASHRVPRPAPCPASRPDLPGAYHPAKVDDGPGGAPGMVAVTQTDFDLLTGNSTRLAKVQQDATALIAAGVAIPSLKD